MKTSVKLAMVDGEYKLVKINEYDLPVYKVPSMEELRRDISHTIKSAIEEKMIGEKIKLVKADNNQQIIAEDGSFYYYNGGRFNKAEYLRMVQLVETVTTKDGWNSFINHPLDIELAIKAVATTIGNCDSKSMIIDTLFELLQVAVQKD